MSKSKKEHTYAARRPDRALRGEKRRYQVIVWGWPIVGIMTCSWAVHGRGMLQLPHGGGLYYWAAKLAPGTARPGPGSPAGSTSWARWPSPPASTSVRRCSSTSCSACGSTSVRRRTGTRCCLRVRAVRPWATEPVRHPAGGAAERHQRLVAHHRRADHRRRADLRTAGGRATTPRPNSCSPTWRTWAGSNIGWWYVLPIGLLMAQYTFTGYDASAHMTGGDP